MVVSEPPANRSGVNEAYIPQLTPLRAWLKVIATRERSTWPNSGVRAIMSAQRFRIWDVKSKPALGCELAVASGIGAFLSPERHRYFRGAKGDQIYVAAVSELSSPKEGFSLFSTLRSRTPTNSRMARAPASPSRGLASLTIRV